MLLSFIFFTGCQSSTDGGNLISVSGSTPLLLDYIHGDSINQRMLAYRPGTKKRVDDVLYYTESEVFYISNLKIRESISEGELEGAYRSFDQWAVNDLTPGERAFLHQTKGEYFLKKANLDSCLKHLNKAYKLEVVNLPKGHFRTYQTIKTIGESYMRLSNRLDSAQYYLNLATELAREYGELKAFTFESFYSMAELSMINRDYLNVHENINRAKAAYDKSEVKRESFLIKCLLLEGKSYRKNSLKAMALNSYKSAVALLEAVPRSDKMWPETYEELATASTVWNDSITFFDHIKVLSSLEKDWGHDVRTNQLSGYYFYKRGDFEKSVMYYEKALETYSHKQNPDLTLVSQAFYSIIVGYQKLGFYERAIEHAFKNISFSTHLRNRELSFDDLRQPELLNQSNGFITYHRLAKLYLDKFRSQRDTIELRRAFEILEIIDDQIIEVLRFPDNDQVLRFLEQSHEIFHTALQVAYYSFQETGEIKYLEAANRYAQGAKGILFSRDLMMNSSELFPQVPESFIDEGRSIQRQLAMLKRYQSERGDVLNKEQQGELDKLTLLQNEHFQRLKTHYPLVFKALKEQVPLSILEIQSALVESEARIQYHLGDEDIIAWYTDEEHVKLFRIPWNQPLQEALTSYIKVLKSPDAATSSEEFEYFVTIGNELYKRLIGPFSEYLDEKQELTIIPDKTLSNLPFGALISKCRNNLRLRDFRDIDFLVKDLSISYSYQSVKQQGSEGIRGDEEISILVYAYGLMKGTSPKGIPDLPSSIEEAKMLSNAFANARPVIKENREATKDNFLEDIGSGATIWHLATHAASSTVNRLDNKIYFRGSGIGKIDSLYAYELAGLKTPPKLVVLTACESGNGYEAEGEGTYSLTRALLQSGVLSVISSHWKQPDKSVPPLMESFYTSYIQTGNPASALRKAKLEFLENCTKNQSHPAFWAGFVSFDSG